MKVAFLGPSGTYSQEAAFKAFGSSHDPLFCASLAEVVSRVALGEVDGAVLPIENSTNGVVALAVDALLQCPKLLNVEVYGDVKVPVRHQLYTHARDLRSIKKVYSHPQVWGQTHNWLAKNLPNAQRIDMSSTAEAVQLALAADSGDDVAALGGRLTSSAEPLVDNCADDPTNTTRFLLLRPRQASKPKATASADSRMWAVTTDNVTLLHSQMTDQHISLRFIASRPSKNPWEYSYLIEFVGSCSEHWTLIGEEASASTPSSHARL